ELFANNDTSDSGFDLIADLNDIEMILFKELTPGDINLIYSAGHPNEAILPPQKTEKEAQPTYPYPQTGSVGGFLKSGGSTTGAKTGISGISGAIGSNKTLGNLGNLVNPADYEPKQEDCPEDKNLDNAIDDYDTKNPAEEPTLSGGGIGAGAGGKTGTGAGAGVETSAEPDIFAINPSAIALDKKELKPAEAGKWKDGQLCAGNKRFCIEITTHASKYNLYYPTDPCIACHVEKINDSLSKLVSHNLAPRKLTGNLMEMAKCKSGYNFSDFVNINIITVPMPIIVPQKMEAIFGRNVIDEFKKFLNKYTYFPTTKATEIADSHASSETTQDDMLREIQNMIYKAKIEAEKQAKNKETLDTSSVQEEFYKSLLYQLEEMKTLFDSFRQLFENISAKCDVIKNKEYVD
ncbi:hypothetical protein HZA39_00150, partial [Candidatus Peregrinibacteria bacterium]|nr:hypothetical protein [Candidatus Peregrinibacteria bacterium]